MSNFIFGCVIVLLIILIYYNDFFISSILGIFTLYYINKVKKNELVGKNEIAIVKEKLHDDIVKEKLSTIIKNELPNKFNIQLQSTPGTGNLCGQFAIEQDLSAHGVSENRIRKVINSIDKSQGINNFTINQLALALLKNGFGLSVIRQNSNGTKSAENIGTKDAEHIVRLYGVNLGTQSGHWQNFFLGGDMQISLVRNDPGMSVETALKTILNTINIPDKDEPP